MTMPIEYRWNYEHGDWSIDAIFDADAKTFERVGVVHWGSEFSYTCKVQGFGGQHKVEARALDEAGDKLIALWKSLRFPPQRPQTMW